MFRARSSTFLFCFGLAGCAGIAGQGADDSGQNGGPDAGLSDGGERDAGSEDAGGSQDGGGQDAGMGSDAGGTTVDGACGAANGVETTLEPSAELCSAGTPSAVAGTGPWTWTCDGSGGGTNASCSAPVPGIIDGVCGMAANIRIDTPPTMDLCDAGTPSVVTEVHVPGGNWLWTCYGTDGGATASCTALWIYSVGICGPANGVPSATPPDAGLCDGGVITNIWATGVTGLPPFGWSCIGTGGGTSQTCAAPAPATGPDGQCGAANDVPVASAPSTALCNVGTASAVGGTGPWNWTCSGSNGGATDYCFAPLPSANSVGTLDAGPSGAAVGTMLLLTDGTLIVHNGGISAAWERLTPDSTGNYANGTWSSMPSMNFSRLFFASAVLPDGRVFVGGGEYGTGKSTIEIFDPVANAWMTDPMWNGNISDSTAEVMPNGQVLLLVALSSEGTIYDATTMTWTATPTKLGGPRPDVNDEESVVQLGDGSFLVVDVNAAGGSQRYVPSSNQWVSAGLLPVQLVDSKFEIGPGLLLYDGRAFYLGATGHTAFYSPASNSWSAGPDIPQGLVPDDAPAAVMPNGHVLFAADTPDTSAPTQLFDFDPTTLLYTAVGPQLAEDSTPMRMLVLPSGEVMINGLVANLEVFTPNGAPNAAWRPSITSVTGSGGTRTVTGVQLNGLNEGAAYGDDSQQASNYPIFELSDATGQVHFARSSGFSHMGVAPGASGTATIDVSSIPAGTYSMVAIANGIASAPVSLTLP